MIVTESDKRRFFQKVEFDRTDECWNWTASCGGTGYGQFYMSGRLIGAHRAMFLIAYGHLPAPGRCVCHTCDNPLCVNPAHLWDGSHQDNSHDAISKGKLPWQGDIAAVNYTRGDDHPMRRCPERRKAASERVTGERHHMVKLKEAQVVEIIGRLAAGETQQALAGEYGVSRENISKIGRNKSWTHLPRPELRP